MYITETNKRSFQLELRKEALITNCILKLYNYIVLLHNVNSV